MLYMQKSKIELLREKYDFQESKLNNSEFLKIYWRMKKDLNDNDFLLNIPLDNLGSYKHQTQNYTISILDDISFENMEIYKYYSHDNCR